jgi:hypothetical protein
MIQQGKLTPEVTARLGDSRGPFVPLGNIESFAVLFPAPAQPGKPAGKSKPSDTLEGMKPAARQVVGAAPKGAYKELVTNYAAHDRAYRRKKAFKAALSFIVKAIVLLVVLAAFFFGLKYGIDYYKAHTHFPENSAAPDSGPKGGTPSK